LLRKCPHAQDVWHAIHNIGLRGAAADTSLKEWLLANLTDVHVDPNWPTKFAITLWYIWKWQCSMCLGSTELIPMDKGVFLYHKFQEILHALEMTDQLHSSARQEPREQWVRWEPPERGWRVLNTDGVVRGTLGPAGVGAVLRGDQEEWIIDFSEHLGHCLAIKAELRAVLHGLKIAKEATMRQLLIQLDSTAVVSMLTMHSLCPSECSGIIQQCKHLGLFVSWVNKGW